jgi:uncharacterized GH25 family protein
MSNVQIGQTSYEIPPHVGIAVAHVSKPPGLPLEIVPESNPHDAPRSAYLPIRLFYEARPLVGALVKLTNLKDDASTFHR